MQPIDPIRTRWVPVLWAMLKRELWLLARPSDGRYDGFVYKGGKKPRRVITEVGTLSGKTFYQRDLVSEIN
jgi:hypothetical protein